VQAADRCGCSHRCRSSRRSNSSSGVEVLLLTDPVDSFWVRTALGYDGKPFKSVTQGAADLDAIVHALVRVSQIAIDWPEIVELDINPLLADETGVVALDARMRVRVAAPGPRDGRLAIRPYPQNLETAAALRDGRRIAIRPIRPEDAPALQAMVQRTDPEDIRLRFLHPMRHLPVQLAARLTQLDFDREIAFAALNPLMPDAIIGVGRLTQDPDRRRAEYAVIVQTDWKGKGLGLILMEMLIVNARAMGLEVIYGEVLSENRAMLDLCRELGFVAHRDPDDYSLTHVELALS
jgi:acetyltransferase